MLIIGMVLISIGYLLFDHQLPLIYLKLEIASSIYIVVIKIIYQKLGNAAIYH